MTQDPLKDLAQLARLREDASGQRLAAVQKMISRLEARAEDLRSAGPKAPDDIFDGIMQDRWQSWRMRQIGELNMQIAQLNFIAQPEREKHARNVARRAVLEKLKKRKGR